jgi:hypothetical protein
MYKTTGYTLATVNNNIMGEILSYMTYVDQLHLTEVSDILHKRVKGNCIH